MSERLSLLSVQGPHSRRLLQSLLLTSSQSSSESPSSPSLSSAPSVLEASALPFSHATPITIGGISALCLRLTFVGEQGFELHVPEVRSPFTDREIDQRTGLYPLAASELASMKPSRARDAKLASSQGISPIHRLPSSFTHF